MLRTLALNSNPELFDAQFCFDSLWTHFSFMNSGDNNRPCLIGLL